VAGKLQRAPLNSSLTHRVRRCGRQGLQKIVESFGFIPGSRCESKLSFSFVLLPLFAPKGNEMARLLLLITIVAFLVAGCAALANQFSGRGVISEQKSETDGSEVVEVSGNNVLSNGGMSSFG